MGDTPQDKKNNYLDGLDRSWSPGGGVRPLSHYNDLKKKRLINFDYDIEAEKKNERAKNPITKRLDAIQ